MSMLASTEAAAAAHRDVLPWWGNALVGAASGLAVFFVSRIAYDAWTKFRRRRVLTDLVVRECAATVNRFKTILVDLQTVAQIGPYNGLTSVCRLPAGWVISQPNETLRELIQLTELPDNRQHLVNFFDRYERWGIHEERFRERLDQLLQLAANIEAGRGERNLAIETEYWDQLCGHAEDLHRIVVHLTMTSLELVVAFGGKDDVEFSGQTNHRWDSVGQAKLLLDAYRAWNAQVYAAFDKAPEAGRTRIPAPPCTLELGH